MNGASFSSLAEESLTIQSVSSFRTHIFFRHGRDHLFSLYMKWIKAPYKGSELLYAAGLE